MIQVNLENKQNQIKVIALRQNIINANIYANLLPIKAVSGSSFTLIKSLNNLDKDSGTYKITLTIIKAKDSNNFFWAVF